MVEIILVASLPVSEREFKKAVTKSDMAESDDYVEARTQSAL